VVRTIYLTLEQVITIHDGQIEKYGGSHGIGRLELLESAVVRPQSTFGGKDLYPTLFIKVAALMHSIVMNHAFVDGNKRTGAVSAVVFLELNGYRLEVGQEQLIKAALDVRYKKWDLDKLAEWLSKNSTKI
jgi:death on curing protein